MPWGVVATAVVGAYTADQKKKAGDKAAGAQEDASNASIAEQRRQFDLTRQDFAPFRDAGVDALGRQSAILNGDFSGFQNSPDYAFNFGQGVQALDRSAAARGGLFGGGHSKDLTTFGHGLASTHLNDYWSKLAGMAGQGYNATSNLGNLGANMANQIGAQYGNIGNARASSYANRADQNSQLAAGIGGAFNNWYQGNQWGGV